MKYLTTILFLVTAFAFFLCSGCQFDSKGQYVYQPPESINDGFDTGTLKEVDMNTAYIEDAVNDILKGRFNEIHSMLIFKDNKLVFEEYFRGHKYKWDAPHHHGEWVDWNKAMLHDVKSVTKSITSTCIGIAIDKGFIKSVHQPIFDYLPEHQHLNTDGKDKITIEHLLTMTSGLEWDEWSAPLSSGSNDIIALWFPPCDDPITCILEKPLLRPPGTHFTYSGGNSILLGEIIQNATNMNIDEFSIKYMFDPLGIDSTMWTQFRNGVIETGGGLELSSRDMAKIGVTFLNNGMWNGRQIISKEWVEKSATNFPCNNGINIPGVASGRNGYSYSWWPNQAFKSGREIEYFNAGGWGGQKIIVVPELNTVVVFTGGNYRKRVRVTKILKKYIIPAIN